MTSGTLAVSLVPRQEQPAKIFGRRKLPRFPAFTDAPFRLTLADAACRQGAPQGSSGGGIYEPSSLPSLPADQISTAQEQPNPPLGASGRLCGLGDRQPLFVRRSHNHAPECIARVSWVKPPTQVFASRLKLVFGTRKSVHYPDAPKGQLFRTDGVYLNETYTYVHACYTASSHKEESP